MDTADQDHEINKLDIETIDIEKTKSLVTDEIPYSIFTLNEKRLMVLLLTVAVLFSPISSTIYYPALGPLAEDLHVSQSKINISITTFMIFQGLAPAFIGAFSDAQGRRPAYLFCFVVYVAANIGLALQSNYAALLVLRCVQSSGSSGTVALANAVVSDISTPHERGKWMGWANAGGLLGPTLGPVIGGLLSNYLGWRAIFWFLAIFGGVYLIPIMLLFPESCRAVVGNGSHRPPPWNTCVLDLSIKKRIAANPSLADKPPAHKKLAFPNPLTTLALLFEPEASLILLSSGFLFAGFYGMMAGLPSILANSYGYDSLHVGLCFLASGVGGTVAALVTGRLMDANFRRHATLLGLDASDTRRIRSLAAFPIEAARMQVALPFIIAGAIVSIAFGWTIHARTHISGPLILLFFTGTCCTGAFTILSTLTVDLFPEKPATATAASNLTRCLLGAGATAAVVPLLARVGSGWTFTIIGVLWAGLVPPLWGVVRWGPGMRRAKETRLKERMERLEGKGVGTLNGNGS